jgi:DNA-binding NarL/FixJ family response regulator
VAKERRKRQAARCGLLVLNRFIRGIIAPRAGFNPTRHISKHYGGVGFACGDACLMGRSIIRVLIVDDFEPWRRFIRLALLAYEKLQVIGEVCDGLEAVRQAQELQPDLILLDIGLPHLNGIEAARKIREVAPASKILFVSENRSQDIVEKALSTGASGYVLKADAARELLAAVGAILQGKQFMSASLAGDRLTSERVDPSSPRPQRHSAGFYSDDQFLLDGLTQFIGTALKAGDAAIVVATESHRERLLLRLEAYGLDIANAIEQGRFIALDAAKAVSAFMRNDLPDPALFLQVADNLITTAAGPTTGAHPRRVALCGECDPPLWTVGKGEAAIRLEQLWNDIAGRYDVDILCAYSLRSHGLMDSHLFGRICAEHSAVHTR